MLDYNEGKRLREALGLEDDSLHSLSKVQDCLKGELALNRIEKLYNMISNPDIRVNSDDKRWVAYTTQASENTTVVEAMKEILEREVEQFHWKLYRETVIEAIDRVGEKFEHDNIKMKPRIPFYVLVLDQLIE